MEEYRIRSRSDIRREKERLLKELQSSGVSLRHTAGTWNSASCS